MIKNMWYVALSSKEVGSKPVGVVRFGERLVLWRDTEGSVECISDICCHRGASLHLGKIHGDNIACPFHGFQYNGSGRVQLIPANGKKAAVPENFKVKTCKTCESDGFIWLWYGDGEPGENPKYFDDIKDMAYSEFSEVWQVHYTRAIENQLDAIHLPFVHHDSIGRGNRTLVNGPVVKWHGDTMFYFYVFNELDDGTKTPKTPAELENEKSQVYLEFKFPNIWQNHITEGIRVTAAFVPIDDSNTMIYLRFYIRTTRVKLIDKMIATLGNVFNRHILHQDRRVVLTQIPRKTDLRMSENLVQGDLPIMEFRKRRSELVNERTQK